MKIKILSLMVMAVLLLAGISCKEAVTPFSPQTDIDNETATNRTTSQNASTETQIKDLKSLNENNKKADLGQKSWDDSRTAPHSASFDHNYGYNPKNPMFKPLRAKTNSTQKTSSLFNESSHHNDFSATDKGTKKSEQQELSLQVHPDKWNVNWKHSQGLLTVRIGGEGYEDIDPNSIRLSISGGGESISPWMAGVKGSALVAKFLKKDAIGLIDSPQAGQPYDIQVSGNFNGEGETSFDPLTDTITIVGQNSEQEENDDEGDEINLSLKIKPDEWSLSWASSADNDDNGEGGVVTAVLSGEDASSIVTSSVRMVLGSCEEGDEGISPESDELEDDEYKAHFSRTAALGLIADPQAEKSYEIHVSGQLEGDQAFCLEYTVTVVSDEEEEEDEEPNLTLEIKPKKWNLAWANNSIVADNDEGDDEEDNNDKDEDEVVTATIKGQGFEDIDQDSVSMSCTEPGVLAEISPVEYEFGEKSFKAKFPQDQAIKLINDPQPGNKYTIVVSGQLNGSSFNLSYEITIHGKKKDDDDDDDI